MIVSLKLLLIKIATDGVNLQVENRDFPGVFDYGFPFGHAEIKGYINEADGDLWDGLILGYENFPQNYGETFFTRNLIGMIHEFLDEPEIIKIGVEAAETAAAASPAS